MLLSKCAICGSKKSIFMKKLEANGSLSSSGLKTPFKKDSIFFLIILNAILLMLFNNFIPLNAIPLR